MAELFSWKRLLAMLLAVALILVVSFAHDAEATEGYVDETFTLWTLAESTSAEIVRQGINSMYQPRILTLEGYIYDLTEPGPTASGATCKALDDRTATILKKLQTHLERTKLEFKNSMRQAMMAVANWYWRAGTPHKHASKALSIQTGIPDNTFSYASIFLGFTLVGMRSKFDGLVATGIAFGMLYGTDATGSEEPPQELHVHTLERDTSRHFEVEIPHYACTSSAQHECPIGPEQESFTQDCAEAASIRDRACKLRRGNNQFCKDTTTTHSNLCESTADRWKYITGNVAVQNDPVAVAEAATTAAEAALEHVTEAHTAAPTAAPTTVPTTSLLGETLGFDSVLAVQTAYEGYACGGTKSSEFVVENADGTDLCVQLKTGALGSGQSASQSRVCANSTTALWSDLTAGNVKTHTFNFKDYEQYVSNSAHRGLNNWTLDASSPLANTWSTGVSMTGSSLTEWDDYDQGCYINQPAGVCPRRAQVNTNGWSMHRDSWGEEYHNSGANQANCEARKASTDTWCGGTGSEWVFIAANSTLKWTKARCRVMMKRGNQMTIEFKRTSNLYKAYYDFIKVSACVSLFWDYRNGTRLVKGQECGVKKLIDITRYEYKCAAVSTNCPTGDWTAWLPDEDFAIWVESDVQSYVSQVV